VRTALVYQGDLQPGLEDSNYFDHLVPFSQLLNL